MASIVARYRCAAGGAAAVTPARAPRPPPGLPPPPPRAHAPAPAPRPHAPPSPPPPRGPLLESCVDLEQRFWHAVTRTGEWTPGVDALCFEEVSYSMFTLAQVGGGWGGGGGVGGGVGGRAAGGRLGGGGSSSTAARAYSAPLEWVADAGEPRPTCLPAPPPPPQLLGFMEVCRREGPRERNFLDEGSLAGSDTLFTLLEVGGGGGGGGGGARGRVGGARAHAPASRHKGALRPHVPCLRASSA